MRRLRTLLLAGVAFAAMGAPAWADDSGWGDGIEVMQEDDLDASRGGFEVAGLEINFGAVVTTFVNGTPALTTQLTWTDVGAVVNQTIGNIGENIDNMTPEQLQTLGLDGLTNAGGVVIDDEAGVTALVHNLTESSLQNIIINNATGRDLTQNIDVTLTLPGFEVIQHSLITEVLGIRLQDDLAPYLPGG